MWTWSDDERGLSVMRVGVECNECGCRVKSVDCERGCDECG